MRTRTTLTVSTFLLVGMGAVNVSAQLKGSDTLEKITADVLSTFGATCGGAPAAGAITYIGTGSSNGEAAMSGQAPTQSIAPMSRNLRPTTACNFRPAGVTNPDGGNVAFDSSKAEGMVFALDGLSLVGSSENLGMTVCNGTSDPTCAPDVTRGLATSTAVAGYTFGNVGGVAGTAWQDVLRVIYAGMSNTAGNNITNRDCNSAVRQGLAADWHKLFQNAGCAGGTCPVVADQLRHAFRRNDESGTTDVFVSLLGLPSINLTAGVLGNATQSGASGPTGQTPFCNAVQRPENLGTGTCTATGTGTYCAEGANPDNTYGGSCNAGAGTCARAGQQCYCQKALPTPPPFANVPPPSTEVGAISGPSLQRFFADHWIDAQDMDPIRRTCAGLGLATGSEDVCAARGDLGLVLPVWDPPNTATPYPTEQCQNGKFVNVAWPFYRSASTGDSGTKFAHCPDGSPAAGVCPVPATVAGNPNCWSARRNGALGALAPRTIDGRVYNLYSFEEDPAVPGSFRVALTTRLTSVPQPNSGNIPPALTDVPMVASFHRLHFVHSLKNVGGADVLCKQTSATDTIGCLVQASPCSIGYAGREAAGIVTTPATGAVSFKVNGVDPQDQCVRNLVASTFFPAVGSPYPLSRRLYLNTGVGFNNVASVIPTLGGQSADYIANQVALATCFADRAKTDTIVSNRKFLSLTADASCATNGTFAGGCNRPTYCEDFNENAGGCTAAANVNQCLTRVGNGDAFPSCQEASDPSTCTN